MIKEPEKSSRMHRITDGIRIPLTTTEGLMVLGWIITVATGWGVLTTKLSAQETKLKELAPVGQQLAVISERVEAIDKRSATTEQMVQEIWKYLLPNKR